MRSTQPSLMNSKQAQLRAGELTQSKAIAEVLRNHFDVIEYVG